MAFNLQELGDNPEIIDFEKDDDFSTDGERDFFYIEGDDLVELVEDGVRFLRPIAQYGDVRAQVLLDEFAQKQRKLHVIVAARELYYDLPDKTLRITNTDDELEEARARVEADCDLADSEHAPIEYPESVAYLDAAFTEMDLILRRSQLEPPVAS